MADLPVSGVELVVKNAQTAIRDLKAYQAALGQQNKVVAQAAVTGNNTSKIMSALGKDFSQMGKNILAQIPGISKFSSLLGAIGTAGTTAAGGATAAAAGTTALAGSMSLALPIIGATAAALGGLFLLGNRGARLEPILKAFGNLASQFGDSTDILNRLRQQTKGAISDFDLMRIATFALSGTSKELGTILAQNLGENLNNISRLATAIGRDPVEAQNRWIDAIKKGERELLDELGIVVSANQAYEAYAKSINKSVDSLTAYDKQAAFAQEATRQLNEAVAKLPEQSGILITMQRVRVVFENIIDRLSIATLPAFRPIMDIVNDVISGIETLASYAIPLLATGFEVIGAVIQEVRDIANETIGQLFGGFADGAGNVLPYVVAAFQLAGEGIIQVIHVIGDVIRFAINGFLAPFRLMAGLIGKAFKGVGENVNLNLTQLAFNLGKGGAQIVGSFAAGIINGGKFVLEAVTAIAQIVADFLVGFSPPKRGPLANIDKGGENVAVTWVGGFLEGVQKSFSEVASYVNERLGAIAQLSREQVEQRLAMLDVALRPFKENLAIVKADMEAIAGFTDPALRIMERQRKSLLKAFGEGKIADIEQLRTLDRQIQRMKELKDFGQDQVDQAELQLALAQSQQSQERALLNIMKDRLGVAEKASGGAGGGAERAARGGGGGGGSLLGGGAGGGGFSGGLPPDLINTGEIDRARQEIINAIGGVVGAGQQGIAAGLGESGFSDALAGFQSQSGRLAQQLGRIQDANPAQKIADKFAGLKDAVSGALNDFKTVVTDTFTSLFGEEGSVMTAINSFKTVLTGIFSGALNPFALANIAITGLVANAQTQFPLLLSTITDNLALVKEAVEGLFTLEDSPFFLAKEAVTTTIEDIKAKFVELKDEIQARLLDIQIYLNAHFIDPGGIIELSKNAVHQMMNFIIDQFFRLTNSGANTLRAALDPLLTVIKNALVMPFHAALTSLANLVADALRSIVDAIGDVLGIAGIDIPTIPQINIPPPMAKGTLGYNKPFIAGEGGKPELVTPARNNPLSVFPGKATAALTSIAGMMNKPAPQPQYIPVPRYDRSGGGDSISDSYNSNKNLTINARQKMTRLEMLQLLSRM